MEDLKFGSSNKMSQAENESTRAPKSAGAQTVSEFLASKTEAPTPYQNQFLQLSLAELLLKTNFREICEKALTAKLDKNEMTEERITLNIDEIYQRLKLSDWRDHWNTFDLDDLKFVSSNEVNQVENQPAPKRTANAQEVTESSPSKKNGKYSNKEPSDFQKEILALDFDEFVSKTNITDIIEREHREKHPNGDLPLSEENKKTQLNFHYEYRHRTEEWWKIGMKNLKFRQCDCKRRTILMNKKIQCVVVKTQNRGLQCCIPGINIGVECRSEKKCQRNIRTQCNRLGAQAEQVPTQLINKVAEVRMSQFGTENNSEKHSERIGQEPIDSQISSHATLLQNVLVSSHACEVMPQSVVDKSESPNVNHSTSIVNANELTESEERIPPANTPEQVAFKEGMSSNTTLQPLRNNKEDEVQQSENDDIIITILEDDDETTNTQNNEPAVAEDSNVPVGDEEGEGVKENPLVKGASASLQELGLQNKTTLVSTQTNSEEFLNAPSMLKEAITDTKSTVAADSQITPENLFTSIQKTQAGTQGSTITISYEDEIKDLLEDMLEP